MYKLLKKVFIYYFKIYTPLSVKKKVYLLEAGKKEV